MLDKSRKWDYNQSNFSTDSDFKGVPLHIPERTYMNISKRGTVVFYCLRCTLVLCALLTGVCIAGRNPVYAQSFAVDSKGNISWGTTATGNQYDGMHYQTIGWTFTVTNGSKKGDYTYYLGTAASSGKDADGRKYNSISTGIIHVSSEEYNENYRLSLLQLEKDTGISVRQGSAVITANAVVEFYYRSKTAKTSKAIAKTRETANSYCSAYNFSSNFSGRYSGYFDQRVTQNYRYLDVKKGIGISSVSGSGWYQPGTAVTVSAAVGTGYSWSKWSGDKSSNAKTYKFTMPAKGITVTANANPNIYQLKLDGNGGTVTRSSGVKSNYLLEKYNTGWGYYNLSGGTSFWSSKNPSTGFTASRSGYEFQGYYTAKSGGKKVIDSKGKVLANTTDFKENTTLYAQWTKKTVKVTFHKNDGSAATVSRTYEYGKADQSFWDPGWNRTGYRLLGWALSGDAAKQNYSITCKILDSWIDKYSPRVDLYAVWAPVAITVNFHRNISPEDKTVTSRIYTYGQAGQHLIDPMWSSSGTFALGWAKTPSAAKPDYRLEAAVINKWIDTNQPSIDLYLIWHKNPDCIIKYHSRWDAPANGMTTAVKEGQTGNLLTLEELGQGFSDVDAKFLGWAVRRESDGKFQIAENPASSDWNEQWLANGFLYGDGAETGIVQKGEIIHLYAQWEYTVTVDPNGGSYYEGTQDGVKVSSSTFQLQFKTTSCPKAYENDSIIYDSDFGGLGIISQAKEEYDQWDGTFKNSLDNNFKALTSLQLRTKPSYTGYCFREWEVVKGDYDSDREISLRYAGDSYIYCLHYAGIRSDLTIRAQWEKNGNPPEKYRVCFDTNGGTAPNPENYEILYGADMPQVGVPEKIVGITYRYNGNGQADESISVGAAFEGYYGKITDSATRYYDEQGAAYAQDGSPRTWDRTEDTWLYAKWGYGSTCAPVPEERGGYSCLGWFTEDGIKIADCGGEFTPERDMVLYARWVPAAIVMKLDPMGGKIPKGETNAYELTYEKELPLRMTVPEKSLKVSFYDTGINEDGILESRLYLEKGLDFDFEGWYEDTDKKDSGIYDSSGKINPKKLICKWQKDTILYALWEVKEPVELPVIGKAGYVLEGWYTNAAGGIKAGNPGEQYYPSGSVSLYARWRKETISNSPAVIRAEDCYFTLQEAREGLVTEEAIFRRANASAWDEEDGEIPMGVCAENEFILYNYSREEFEMLTDGAQISETFRAKDSDGNLTCFSIWVYIVDTEAQTDAGLKQQFRFISEKYLNRSENLGGLCENSIWRKNEYQILLKSALSW